MVCKMFVCSEYPNIPENSRREKNENREALAKRYAFQPNAKSVCFNRNEVINAKCLHVYFILV